MNDMQNIGERLEEARKRKGITIREASEATKIRGDYLNSFENNNFAVNIPEIYVRGFLRSYANYLKINADKIVTDFNAALLGEAKTPKRDNREFLGRLDLRTPIISNDDKEETAKPERSNHDEADDAPFWKNLKNVAPDLWIKIGIAASIAVAVVIGLVFLVSSILNSPVEPVAETPVATAPLAESVSMTLVALGDVRVGVTQLNPEIELFFGVIPKGTEQKVDVRGSVRLTWDNSANLVVRVGGNEMAMPKDRTFVSQFTPSKYLK